MLLLELDPGRYLGASELDLTTTLPAAFKALSRHLPGVDLGALLQYDPALPFYPGLQAGLRGVRSAWELDALQAAEPEHLALLIRAVSKQEGLLKRGV